MRRLLVLLSVLVSLLSWSAPSLADDAPRVGEERIVLRTVAGDLVLALYPDVAPKTVEQILKMVRAGVYDTTAFVRLEPNFVAQLSAAHDRTTPLTPAQQELIHKIPAEFSDVKHVRGMLSMAREDADINSAETSFSILLGPAPHLDGKYTVFGRLEAGDAVLEEMLKVPRGPMLRPVTRLDVTRAEVIPASELGKTFIAPARAVATSPAAAAAAAGAVPQRRPDGTTPLTGPPKEVATEAAYGLAFLCLIGLLNFFLQGKVPASVHGSLNLVMVLVGAFLFIMVIVPKGQEHPYLATALFFGMVGLFKVLGRFERPAEVPKKT